MPAPKRPRRPKSRPSGMRAIRKGIALGTRQNLSKLRKQLAEGKISKEDYLKLLHSLKQTIQQAQKDYQ